MVIVLRRESWHVKRKHIEALWLELKKLEVKALKELKADSKWKLSKSTLKKFLQESLKGNYSNKIAE